MEKEKFNVYCSLFMQRWLLFEIPFSSLHCTLQVISKIVIIVYQARLSSVETCEKTGQRCISTKLNVTNRTVFILKFIFEMASSIFTTTLMSFVLLSINF